MAGDTFLFADIVGFTSYTERDGDDAAADLAARFRAGVEAILPEGARLVKTMGDAVMVRLDDPAQAATTAVRIAQSALGAGDPPVRVGVHSGTAVERDGDFFGAAVNIAARVAAFAQPGEALATPEVAEAARAFGLATVDRGERRLRNVLLPIHVAALAARPVLRSVEGVAA
jgi:adenylate cyclase